MLAKRIYSKNLLAIRVFLIMLITSNSYSAYTQKHTGIVVFSDSSKPIKCRFKVSDVDSTTIQRYFSNCLTMIYMDGFLASRIDSVDIANNPITAYGTRGVKFLWVNLYADSMAKGWLRREGLRIEAMEGNIFKPDFLAKAIGRSLFFLENNGYPFAKYSLYNTKITGESISTHISLNKGPLVVYDTLYIKGNASISHTFLETYLSFRKGHNYSEKNINQIDGKINRLPFLSLVRPSEVEFTPGKVRVYAYVDGKPSNRFSGLLGFASGSQASPGIKLTGSINLSLINALGKAESMSVRWNAQGEGSQRLMMNTDWPLIRGTNMALEGSFSLYKRDSTYLNINPFAALGFYTLRGEKISVGFNQKSSRTISATSQLNVSDFSTSLASLSYQYSNLSKSFLPIKGFELNSHLNAGRRRVRNNGTSKKWDTSSLIEVGLSSRFFLPIYKESVIISAGVKGVKISLLQNENGEELYENELLFVGGSESLRGFNEESIITNGYALLETEIHFRFSATAGVFVFFDKSIVSTFGLSNNISWPTGAGGGFLIDTEGGVFNLNYALGKGFGQDFRFRDAKLHVGYTASF